MNKFYFENGWSNFFFEIVFQKMEQSEAAEKIITGSSKYT